ncbi:MAG: HigA family addiction module antitoxin [Coriobacteriia bacterium]|nr:HigA family addiction module antitoxin [Coriobacteriia bacterium]
MSVKNILPFTTKPPHPGEFLREDYLPECGLSVAAFAARLGVSRQTANELVHERRAVSPEMALRLGKLFGTTPQYWLNLQRNVDLWDSLQLNQESIEAIDPVPQVAVE